MELSRGRISPQRQQTEWPIKPQIVHLTHTHTHTHTHASSHTHTVVQNQWDSWWWFTLTAARASVFDTSPLVGAPCLVVPHIMDCGEKCTDRKPWRKRERARERDEIFKWSHSDVSISHRSSELPLISDVSHYHRLSLKRLLLCNKNIIHQLFLPFLSTLITAP